MDQFWRTVGQNRTPLAGTKSGLQGADIVLHANGLATLQVVEVNDVGLIENRQMDGLSRALSEHIQKRLRHIGDVKPAPHQRAHDEEVDTESVTPVLWVLLE